jgi:L-ascorbate metabolism protein UlaG (beta-lactamase superfamily)
MILGYSAAPLLGQTDVFPAEGGEIRITHYTGASVQVEYSGIVVHVDPWSRGDYTEARPADIILVTDTPGDHLDPEMIRRLRTDRTIVIVPSYPADARDEGGAERLREVEGADVMNNNERAELIARSAGVPDVTIESIPMYDVTPGEPFHALGEGNGYVLTLGGVRIYFAGVTECTPEMRAVQDIDIAFVPMNLPNGRMSPAVAADCVSDLAPAVVYPYHYRDQPIDEFVERLRATPVEVRLHNWYPD